MRTVAQELSKSCFAERTREVSTHNLSGFGESSMTKASEGVPACLIKATGKLLVSNKYVEYKAL